MDLDDYTKKKIDVLLNEYQACYRDRNHFDGLIWTIGGVFAALSLASVSASFLQGIAMKPLEVNVMAIFSIALMLLWYFHIRYLTPYVMVLSCAST